MIPDYLRKRIGDCLALSLGLGLVGGGALLWDPLLPVADRVDMDDAVERFELDLEAYREDPIDFGRLSTLRSALPAFEDRGYDERPTLAPPVSPSGLARAVWRNLHGVREGGSTLPQQAAKLYLRDAGRSPSLEDKAVELALATWMVRHASKDELLGLYMERAAEGFLGTTAGAGLRPIERFSLAMFGQPLDRLGREDQFLLAASMRGPGWMRSSAMAPGRLERAREWMVASGTWDSSIPSFLDDAAGSDTRQLFTLTPDWQARLATADAGSTDADLVAAIDSFRSALGHELRLNHPGTRARMAFAVVGSEGSVLARSGSESMAMRINYGSVAKLEPLAAVVDAVGPGRVLEVALEPTPSCIRWSWVRSVKAEPRPAAWCPSDVARPDHPMTFDEAVARSVNTMTAKHLVMWPYRLSVEAPSVFERIVDEVPPVEQAALDSDSDRALAAGLLTSVGMPSVPDDVPRRLSYTVVETGWFRYLAERREAAGLPSDMADDPTSVLGNSSRATVEEVGRYVHTRLFDTSDACRFSDVGWLLAERRTEGTLRWLASRHPALVVSGKTGTSPHSDAALAAVGLCLDGRAVVLVGAIRPTEGTLPDGLHGSAILRGIDGYLGALDELQRPVTSPEPPSWATPAAAAVMVELEKQ